MGATLFRARTARKWCEPLKWPGRPGSSNNIKGAGTLESAAGILQRLITVGARRGPRRGGRVTRQPVSSSRFVCVYKSELCVCVDVVGSNVALSLGVNGEQHEAKQMRLLPLLPTTLGPASGRGRRRRQRRRLVWSLCSSTRPATSRMRYRRLWGRPDTTSTTSTAGDESHFSSG